jgi:intein/homing endonuclease
MPIWADLKKIFQYANEKDSLAKRRDTRNLSGAGISSVDAIGSEFQGGQSPLSLRQTYDMIDTTTLTNRTMRYKEYERLRNMPEIEMVMTVLSDEACVVGSTPVATPHGFITIKELAERFAEERFLVYCYDFEKQDYSLGWAYAPRLVKKEKTIEIVLDNGDSFEATPDHRVLKRDGTWVETKNLKWNDELMAFYRMPARQDLTKSKVHQYPRIFTKTKGWIHEKQFVEEWTGNIDEKMQEINKYNRMIASGLSTRQIEKATGRFWGNIHDTLNRKGFSWQETKHLGNQKEFRRVIGISHSRTEKEVYDISVEKHKCFASKSVILHNCQKDEYGNVMKIECKNEEIREELEFLFFNRKMLNINYNSWIWFKNLCIHGDWFLELVIDPDNPKHGIYKTVPLPPETMYRIETIKQRLIEFQQSKEGPDYQALIKGPVTQQTESELNQTTAIRFDPHQIVHFRIGSDRKTFYPYGESLIEPARGPAHSLRLMEDSMVTYRLCLVGNTRIRTKQGYKYIKDITLNDEVYSYVDDKPVLTKVTLTKNNGVKPVYRVRSKHIEITGTETHPILVERDGQIQYISIKDLIVKKDRLIPVSHHNNELKEIPRTLNAPWAKLSELQRQEFKNKKYKNKRELLKKCFHENRTSQFLYMKGKALPLEKAKQICEIFGLNEKELIILDKGQINAERISTPQFVTEEFARLFGFLCGNGNISNSNLNFAATEDKKLNEYYKNILEQYFGRVRFTLDKRSKYNVSSAFACNLFKKLGYINNHKINRIPDWVFSSPKNIRRAFVEGLSDANGCERYTKKDTWFSTIALCNKQMIEDIKELWSSIGLNSGHIKTRKRIGGHEIEPGRIIPDAISYELTISNLFLPKSENILEVKYIGEEEVHDIGVENQAHNFIANGTPVHNSRAPERRVYYIDVGQLPPFKADAYLTRIKDQLRKRKVANNSGSMGASVVEEKWQPPAVDEDIWLAVRPNSNTKIDTLPGAQNLGEIDDSVYFRNKLFTALCFPKSYLSNEDPGATRITLSAQDVKFARMVERLQGSFENGIYQIAETHLQLRGYPEDSYDDLKLKMTPPSDWRELSRAEVQNNRYGNASTLKSMGIMADYDIYIRILKYDEDEVEEMLARLKLQKLEDLKFQIIAQNPQLAGMGIPGQQDKEQELGSEPGGPNEMPQLPGQEPNPQGNNPNQPPQQNPNEQPPMPKGQKNRPEGMELPEPEEHEIKKYDLELQGYEAEQDDEPIDYSVPDHD